MKIKQRIISILTTLAMSAAMVMPVGIYQPVTVSADTSITITLPANDEGTHEFKAYQILAGDVKDNKLAVTGWGSGVDYSGLITALTAETADMFSPEEKTKLNGFSESLDQATYLAYLLSQYKDTDGFADKFAAFAQRYVTGTPVSLNQASGVCSADVDSAGYYIIIDSVTDTNPTDTALSKYMLYVAGTVSENSKTDLPTIKKEITAINGTDDTTIYDESGNINSTDQNAATACIGDTITYTLTSPVPDMSAYDSYYFEMQDTLSTGLTFKEFSEVKIGDATLDSSKYTATHTEGSITIKIDDLKALNPDAVASITATYTATLNANAVIYNQVTAEGAEKGNVNSAALVYSNDPNSTSHGTTHPDITKVYTTEIVIRKIDGNTKEPLTGAVFELQLEYATDTYKTIDTKTVENADGTITFTGLGAGTYKVVETKAPDGGYNKVNTDVVITATPTLEGVEWSYNSTESNIITVENKRGLILPSTGGIGTTIFYVIGGGIIIAAVILFVVRRKSAK